VSGAPIAGRYAGNWKTFLVCGGLLLGHWPIASVAADETANPSASSSRPDADAAYRLRYKFVSGQVVRLVVKHQTRMTTTKESTSVIAVNTSNTDKHFRVVSVDSQGNAVLEPVIDRVRMQARIGRTDPVKYDSASSKPVPKPFVAVQETVGKALAQLTVTPSGKLVSSKVLLSKQTAAAVTARAIPTTEDSSRRNFLVVLPSEPVRVGQTWQDKFKVRVRVTRSLSRDIQLLRKYTLKSIDQGIATIDLKTAALTPVRDAGIRAQLIQMTPAGTIRFDIDKGLIVSRRLVVDEMVIGQFGGNSSLKAKSTRTEQLVDAPRVARETKSSGN